MNNEFFDMAKLGRNISTLRKAKNYTQGKLAEEMGVSHQAISSWENGLTSPDISNLKELSRIFDTSIDELMDNKTITKAVEKIDQHQTLSEDELVQVAPIVPPHQFDQVIEQQDKAFNLSAIIQLLPYMESETLTEWIKADTSNRSLKELSPLFPFLDEDGMAALVKKYPITIESAVSLFPFLEDELIESITLSELENKSLKEITPILPYMSEEKIDKLVLELVKNGTSSANDVTSAAPYMSSKGLKEVAMFLIQADSSTSLTSLLPFLED